MVAVFLLISGSCVIILTHSQRAGCSVAFSRFRCWCVGVIRNWGFSYDGCQTRQKETPVVVLIDLGVSPLCIRALGDVVPGLN